MALFVPVPPSCPLCQGAFRAVQVIDKSDQGPTHLEYSAIDAQRSPWTGSVPMEGTVVSVLCQGCGFLMLFGASYEQLRQQQAQAKGQISLAQDGTGQLSEPDRD